MDERKPACIIGHITVKDPEKWAAYCAAVPHTIAPYQASLVLRGRRSGVLTGTHDRTETVVIRFPDIQAVNAWYASQAYQGLVPLREAAADVTIIAYEI